MKANTILLALIALAIGFSASFAQDEKKEKKSDLGVRHQRIERMMMDIERKFTSLSEQLREQEPERAKRLVQALQKAKELLIQKRLGDITEMLNDAKYDNAIEEQAEIIANIKELIKLLLNEQADEDKAKEKERRELEEWARNIRKIIKEETQQADETKKIANKDDTLKDYDAQIAAIKELIKKQGDVNASAEKSASNGISAMERVANEQHKVRKQTEDVTSKIKKAGEDVPTEDKDGQPKDGQSKDGQSKDGQPKDGQSQRRAIQRRAIQRRTIQRRTKTGQRRTIQRRTIQRRTIQRRTIQRRTIQRWAIQRRAIQRRTIQRRTIQRRTITGWSAAKSS